MAPISMPTLAEKFRFQAVKTVPGTTILIITTVLSYRLALLLRCDCLAVTLRNCHMFESRSSICASPVYPRIDSDGGGNRSITTARDPLHPTRLSFDALEHRHLR